MSRRETVFGRLDASRLGIVAVIVAFVGCSPPPVDEAQPTEASRLKLTSLLAGSAEGFARAVEPREFEFPSDHGQHPDFRTEWWYLTGNLESLDGRRFGYQFTIFRNALVPEPRGRESAWATEQIYMAHLAVTDVGGRRFLAFERFARGAVGLAGAETRPFRVWLADWRLEGGDAPPPFRLRASNDEIALDLALEATKPLVLQGDSGLSRKGHQPGNASYYYALTRLRTTGRLRVGSLDVKVRGSSWLDREWSSSVLEEGQRGWDWFALQLDDGTDLMVYQMRRDDGAADPLSSGSLIEADGAKTDLRSQDFGLEVLDRWTSSSSGVRYPSGWRLSVPAEDLFLRIEPVLRDQELRLSVLYWEGAVRVEGSRAGARVTGTGYVELTGYAGR
jgi:predicted secreted hydrolase